ncbi:MAG: helix-hairpin-helix domain-containing protein [Candidatus Cloacimonadota bacterium]|nr:MAG: helix-hairpin-helix domain-containing protein [Candidatus Cloacimonadota bacterium]
MKIRMKDVVLGLAMLPYGTWLVPNKKSSLLIFFFISSLSLSGNEDFSLEEETSLPSDVLETLEKLKENPIDINSATHEELLQIPYITPLLAARIEDYRKKKKMFSSREDLLRIAGINEPLLRKISPYITLKKKRLKISAIRWKTILSNKYPVDTNYSFSPFKVSNKMRYSDRHITLGGTAYKDAYEKSYIDFYTLYCYFQKNDYNIIVGNYAIDAGERLLLGYPGFVFKTSGIVKSREYFIKPYSSGFEDYSLRGCALKKDWKMLKSGFFISYKKEDATIDDGVLKKVIYETGYHRSETEIEKKDRIKERLIGGIIGYGNERLRISTTTLFADYDKKVEPDSVNYYRFSGKKYGLTGVHTVYNNNNISLWSEFAYALFTKGRGMIIGTSCRPNKTTISVLYRDYSEKFYSPRAFSFCESEARNERGLYTYITSKLPENFFFSGYIDIFNRPYPTYFNSLSTKGYEVFSSIEKRLKKTKLYIRYKRKEKNSYQWKDKNLRYQRQNLRFSIKNKINKSMELKILWEGVIFYVPYRGLQETGNLFSLSFKSEIFDDATYEAGMVFYETDSYYSRIYLFLIDIPGSMYTRPFYGEGKDFYVLVKARILDKLRIYGRVEVDAKEEKNDRILKVGVEWR